MSSAKWRPFRPEQGELIETPKLPNFFVNDFSNVDGKQRTASAISE